MAADVGSIVVGFKADTKEFVKQYEALQKMLKDIKQMAAGIDKEIGGKVRSSTKSVAAAEKQNTNAIAKELAQRKSLVKKNEEEIAALRDKLNLNALKRIQNAENAALKAQLSARIANTRKLFALASQQTRSVNTQASTYSTALGELLNPTGVEKINTQIRALAEKQKESTARFTASMSSQWDKVTSKVLASIDKQKEAALKEESAFAAAEKRKTYIMERESAKRQQQALREAERQKKFIQYYTGVQNAGSGLARNLLMAAAVHERNRRLLEQQLSVAKRLQLQFNQMYRTVFNLKTVMLIMVGGFVAATGNAIGKMQNQMASLKTMAPAGVTGDTLYNTLATWAFKTNVSTEKAIELYTRLRAVGLEPSIKDMNMLLDLANAVGVEALPRIGKAIGDVAAKGYLSGEEVRQFVNAGINIKDALIKAGKMKESDRSARVADLMISAKDVIFAIEKLVNERFKGLTANMMDTWTGVTQQLGDIWNRALAGVGMTSTLPVFTRLKDLMNSLVQSNPGRITNFLASFSGILGMFENIALNGLIKFAQIFEKLVLDFPKFVRYAETLQFAWKGFMSVMAPIVDGLKSIYKWLRDTDSSLAGLRILLYIEGMSAGIRVLMGVFNLAKSGLLGFIVTAQRLADNMVSISNTFKSVFAFLRSGVMLLGSGLVWLTGIFTSLPKAIIVAQTSMIGLRNTLIALWATMLANPIAATVVVGFGTLIYFSKEAAHYLDKVYVGLRKIYLQKQIEGALEDIQTGGPNISYPPKGQTVESMQEKWRKEARLDLQAYTDELNKLSAAPETPFTDKLDQLKAYLADMKNSVVATFSEMPSQTTEALQGTIDNAKKLLSSFEKSLTTNDAFIGQGLLSSAGAYSGEGKKEGKKKGKKYRSPMLKDASVIQDWYAEILKKQREWDKEHNAFTSSIDEMNDKWKLWTSFGVSSIEQVGDSLNTFIVDGKFKFSDFIYTIINELSKLIIKMTVVKYLAESVNAVIGGFTGSSSSTAVSVPSAMLTSAGQYTTPAANQFASGGTITEPVIGFGVNSGQSYSFAEKGSETILPHGANLGSNIKVELVNKSGSEIQATSSSTTPTADGYVVKVVLDAVARNVGGLRSAISGVR